MAGNHPIELQQAGRKRAGVRAGALHTSRGLLISRDVQNHGIISLEKTPKIIESNRSCPLPNHAPEHLVFPIPVGTGTRPLPRAARSQAGSPGRDGVFLMSDLALPWGGPLTCAPPGVPGGLPAFSPPPAARPRPGPRPPRAPARRRGLAPALTLPGAAPGPGRAAAPIEAGAGPAPAAAGPMGAADAVEPLPGLPRRRAPVP